MKLFSRVRAEAEVAGWTFAIVSRCVSYAVMAVFVSALLALLAALTRAVLEAWGWALS